MKSGVMPVSSMALTMANHSGMAHAELEAHRLAAGQLAQRATNFIKPMGVSKAEWVAGELQSAMDPARLGDLGRDLAGRMPWPGLAPCDSLISIIFTCGVQAFLTKASSENAPCSSRQPKYPEPMFHTRPPPGCR